MWPLHTSEDNGKKKGRKRRMIRRVVVGFIIGGAISSIVGKALLHQKRKEHAGEEEQ